MPGCHQYLNHVKSIFSDFTSLLIRPAVLIVVIPLKKSLLLQPLMTGDSPVFFFWSHPWCRILTIIIKEVHLPCTWRRDEETLWWRDNMAWWRVDIGVMAWWRGSLGPLGGLCLSPSSTIQWFFHLLRCKKLVKSTVFLSTLILFAFYRSKPSNTFWNLH